MKTARTLLLEQLERREMLTGADGIAGYGRMSDMTEERELEDVYAQFDGTTVKWNEFAELQADAEQEPEAAEVAFDATDQALQTDTAGFTLNTVTSDSSLAVANTLPGEAVTTLAELAALEAAAQKDAAPAGRDDGHRELIATLEPSSEDGNVGIRDDAEVHPATGQFEAIAASWVADDLFSYDGRSITAETSVVSSDSANVVSEGETRLAGTPSINRSMTAAGIANSPEASGEGGEEESGGSPGTESCQHDDGAAGGDEDGIDNTGDEGGEDGGGYVGTSAMSESGELSDDGENEGAITLPDVKIPNAKFPDHGNGSGGFEPVVSPRNFTDTIVESDSEQTSTHIITQTWSDEDHWSFTEQILVGYDIARTTTDEAGGDLTVNRSGHFNVTFHASKGQDIAPDAGAGVSFTLTVDIYDRVKVTYDLSVSETLPGGSASADLLASLTVYAGINGTVSNRPVVSPTGESGREVKSNGSARKGARFEIDADWEADAEDGDLAAGDGWRLEAGGHFNAEGNSGLTITWDVMATKWGCETPPLTGTLGATLNGGGEAEFEDEFTLEAQAKDGDYAAGDGWKGKLDIRSDVSADTDSSDNFEYEARLGVGPEGEQTVDVITDEFDISADANSDNEHSFALEFNSKEPLPDGESQFDLEIRNESGGDFTLDLDLNKPTGGEPSGNVDLEFNGDGKDEFYVFDKAEEDWLRTGIDPSTGVSFTDDGQYLSELELDEVANWEYDGQFHLTLTSGDSSSTASVNSQSDVLYDGHSLDKGKTRHEESSSGSGWSMWEAWKEDWKDEITEHYEADVEVDVQLQADDSTTTTITANDNGYTEANGHFETSHSWNNTYTDPLSGTVYSDAGGPENTRDAWRERVDWPSYVDEVIAMLQFEVDMAAGDESEDPGGGGGGDDSCPTCMEPAGDDGEDPGGIEPVPETISGQLGTIAWETALGWWQGGLNTVNGVQDLAVSGVNVSPAGWIYRGVMGEPIESPDWSRGVLSHEAGEPGSWGDTHGWSKWLGGNSIVIALGAGTAADAGSELLSTIVIRDHVAGKVFKFQTLGGVIAEGTAASVTTVPVLIGSGAVTLAFAYPVQTVAIVEFIIDNVLLDPGSAPLTP